jgi:hypothetical protein
LLKGKLGQNATCIRAEKLRLKFEKEATMNKRFLSILWVVIISLTITSAEAIPGTSRTILVGATGYETLAEAIATLGSGTHVTYTLVVSDGLQQILTNLTIPINITLKVLNGANIQIAPNTTLSIQGPFIAGPYQVFTDNSGDLTKGVKFYPTCNLSFLRPEWWGAVGDNNKDCTPAINKAINSKSLLSPSQDFCIPVQFGAGLYLCYSTINVVQGTTLQGVSGGYSPLRGNTALAVPHGAKYSLIKGNKADNVCIQNMMLGTSGDCSGKLVFLSGGGTGGFIRGCQFATAGYPADGNSWAIYLDNQSSFQVNGNYFSGSAGVFMSGANSQFCNNELQGAGQKSIALCVNSACTVYSNIIYGWYAGMDLHCPGMQVHQNRVDQCTYAIRNLSGSTIAGIPSRFTGNRLGANVYGFLSDQSAQGAIFEANNILQTKGSGTESVPTAAVLSAGDGNCVQQNRFDLNTTNIAGPGTIQASNNFGIDLPY